MLYPVNPESPAMTCFAGGLFFTTFEGTPTLPLWQERTVSFLDSLGGESRVEQMCLCISVVHQFKVEQRPGTVLLRVSAVLKGGSHGLQIRPWATLASRSSRSKIQTVHWTLLTQAWILPDYT